MQENSVGTNNSLSIQNQGLSSLVKYQEYGVVATYLIFKETSIVYKTT